MSVKRTVVAIHAKRNRTITADSVTAMAKKMGVSRTNLSDVINGREGRETVKAGTWFVA
jgi:hypothetical protein